MTSAESIFRIVSYFLDKRHSKNICFQDNFKNAVTDSYFLYKCEMRRQQAEGTKQRFGQRLSLKLTLGVGYIAYILKTHLWLEKGCKMLLFCPTCSNVLTVEEGTGPSSYRFACQTCPYVYNITKKVTYSLLSFWHTHRTIPTYMRIYTPQGSLIIFFCFIELGEVTG